MSDKINEEKDIIKIDSINVYDKTAIIQMSTEAWVRMKEYMNDNLKFDMKYSVYNQTRDHMFRALFNNKENLLSLYNAIGNKEYTNPDDLEIVTLEGAIYMGMKNDLSFIISNGLYMFEHQSTDNVNIPLRDLFYIAEQYRVMTVKKNIYSSSKISLPTPHFVVLYNGKTKREDNYEYRLSDAYERKEECYDLDLTVHVININQGHNKELLAKCKTLEEFSRFSQILRDFNKTLDISQAIHSAINYCIDHDILKDYLLNNKAEVENMVLYDWDLEKYKEEREDEVRQRDVIIQQQADEIQQLSDEIKHLRELLAKTQ